MKKGFKKYYIIVPVVLVIVLVFRSCFFVPPSKETEEKRFQRNYNDIQIVVDFMVDSGYDSIQINAGNGTMWADFQDDVAIEEKRVRDAIGRLLGSSSIRQYYYIYKTGNTIRLKQWSGFAGVFCGIAYSINETDLPYIDYPTVLEPMSEPGWYYYVDDYNTWRSEHS